MKFSTYLNITDLRFSYRHQPVFNGLNLSVGSAGIYCLSGDNGTGKSTLMKLITGHLRSYQGSIRLLDNEPGFETNRFVSYQPAIVYERPTHTIKDHVMLYQLVFEDFDTDLALERFHHHELQVSKALGSFSSGQRALIQVIMTLSRQTPLYLLDEPFTRLDTRVREQVAELIRETWDNTRCMLISTHELAEMEPLFDALLRLEEGELVLEGSMQDLRDRYGCTVAELIRKGVY